MSKNIINYYKIKMDIEHITIQAYGIFINKYNNHKIYEYLCEELEKQKQNQSFLIFYIHRKTYNIGFVKNNNDELFVYYKVDLIDQYVSSWKPHKCEINSLTSDQKKTFEDFVEYLSEKNMENIYELPKYYMYYYND